MTTTDDAPGEGTYRAALTDAERMRFYDRTPAQNPTENSDAIPFDALAWMRRRHNRVEDETLPVWKLRRETVEANRASGVVFT